MGAAESLRENGLRVVVSDDLLEAYVVADGACTTSRAELIALLATQGVAGPADEAGIASFVAEHPIGIAVRVVRGRAPTSGGEVRIEYPFKSLEERGAGASGEHEPFAVDHRETRALERCEAGDVLARRVAGVEAADGVDAYGRTLPADRGRDVKLAAGSNATLSEDGASVVAGIAGVPSRDASGRIVVNPAVTVKNVDFKSGNVHFEGSVLIEGDVLQGFSVEAGGDVEIKGSVEHATIRAGGSIHVKGGVRRHSVLRAARDVEVRFADSECHLEARGWVRVAQNAIQCELIGDEGVLVGGQLVSGRAQSWDVIEAGYLGCPHGAQTVVAVERPNSALRVHALREELGLPPHPAAGVAGAAGVSAGGTIEHAARHTSSGIRPLGLVERAPPSTPIGHAAGAPPARGARGPLPGALSRLPTPGMLPKPGLKKIEALRPAPTGAKEAVKSKVTALVERRERESLLAHAERELAAHHVAQGRVLARTGVRPGVTISIAHDVLAVDEDLGPRAFYVGESGIAQAPVAPASSPSGKVAG
jgi:uncharacterized protein (DUF342 family)